MQKFKKIRGQFLFLQRPALIHIFLDIFELEYIYLKDTRYAYVYRLSIAYEWFHTILTTDLPSQFHIILSIS